MVACKSLWFLLLVFSLKTCVQSVIVQTDKGLIEGSELKTPQGKTVSTFLGVPYALPPLGEYRFQEPYPADKWEGVRPAHNFSSRCIQFVYYKNTNESIEGDEDCLYLNIFTPQPSSNAKLDVLVYIHGGAFMFGGGDIFTPDFILDHHDLVYVSINYRLGPFGFLTTEDGVIPGNNGLKDQVLALKWVQDNIEQFGGDKNKVTIAGMSAGGATIHLHYFSPLSRNLFNRGISLSGSAFCPWVLAENSLEKAKTLAKSEAVNCPTSDSVSMLACFKTRSARDFLIETDTLFMPWHFNPFSPFGPVVENNSNSAFLDRNPYELLSEGKVKDAPWLASVTTEEGLYPGASIVTFKQYLQQLDENWNKIAPHLLDYNHTVSETLKNDVSDKIRKFYLKDKTINTENRKELVQMISDRLFVADVERAARLQASVTTSPVYFYSYAYRGKYSTSDSLCGCNENLGASHGDDLMYILKTNVWFSPLETESDKEMSNILINIWTTFVETGKPSASPDSVWIPISPDAADGGTLNYLLISSGNDIKAASTEDLGNRKFWDSLPFEELWNAGRKKNKLSDEL